MRRVIVLSLLLAACTQSQQPPADPWSPSAHRLYAQLVKDGWPAAEARVHVDKVIEASHDLGRYDKRVEKRQGEIAEVRSGACANDPSLSYC